MPEKRKITPVPSNLTNAPSPSNTNQETEEYDDQDSFESAESSSSSSLNDPVLHHQNSMSNPMPSQLTQRQHAFAINTSLNKLNVSEKLKD